MFSSPGYAPDARCVQNAGMSDEVRTTPAEALKVLLEGNARFIRGEREHPHQDADRRTAVAPGQTPFAVLFGCSDSRLAAELIFDRGLGDLFVVRTAGHVIGPEVIGSIEYGVTILDTPLIAVLGHDNCGAVGAAMRAVTEGALPSGEIRHVVKRVMPSVLAAGPDADDAEAGAEHVRHTVDAIVNQSMAIAAGVEAGIVAVVGLQYDLADGDVHVVSARGL
jgi:carbonic anhydrase